MNASLIG